MDENDEAPGGGFGAEQIEAVSRPLTIGNVERRAAAALKFIAIDPGGLHPGLRPALAAGNVGTIGVGVVPVGNLMKDHRCRFPVGPRHVAQAMIQFADIIWSHGQTAGQPKVF